MQQFPLRLNPHERAKGPLEKVFEDLLCWGVGEEKVDKLVKTLLGNHGGTHCYSLLKATFARCVYLEACHLAKIQVAQQLLHG